MHDHDDGGDDGGGGVGDDGDGGGGDDDDDDDNGAECASAVCSSMWMQCECVSFKTMRVCELTGGACAPHHQKQWPEQPTTSRHHHPWPAIASTCLCIGRQLLARSGLLKRVSASCAGARQATVSQHHSSGMQKQHRRMATTHWQPRQQPQQHSGSHDNSHNNTAALFNHQKSPYLHATRASVFSLASLPSAQRRRWMQDPPRRDVGHHWRHGQLLHGHCWHSVPLAVAMPVRHHEPQLHFQRLSCCAQTSAPSPPS
jgi:hypothetical protein